MLILCAFFCRAGEEDSSHSADVLLRRTGGAAGIAPLPWRSCSTIGWYWISTVLSGNVNGLCKAF